MKLKTKVEIIIAIFIAIIALIPNAVRAGTYDGFTYEIENDEVTIIYGPHQKDVEIPEMIDGYKVTKIAGYAFESNYELENITISENVKDIGSSAFESCRNLKTITILSKEINIGRSL